MTQLSCFFLMLGCVLSQYLNVIVVVVVLQLLPSVGRVAIVLPPGVECVHHDLLGALDFRPAERATLRMGRKEIFY